MLSVMGDDDGVDVDGGDGDVDDGFVASNRCITKQVRS